MERNCITCLKLQEWPETDRRLWLAAKTGSRLRARKRTPGRRRPASSWRSATQTSVEVGYGTFLAWYYSRHDHLAECPPIERVTVEVIEAFMEFYAPGRAQSTVAGTLRGVAYMVRATSPPDGLEWLTNIAHHLANTAKPARAKVPRMATVAELQGLAHILMVEAITSLKSGSTSACVDFRDGLMIALLAARPMRLRNLIDLRIGETLLIGENHGRIVFHGGKTKTARPINWALPATLLSPICYYLAEIRPLLLRLNDRDEGWLWLSRRGRPMSGEEASTRIGLQTLRRLNRRVSPQLFRDCVATDIAVLDPSHVGMTMPILGHARISTSQKYYNQAKGIVAGRRLDATIDALVERRDGETEP